MSKHILSTKQFLDKAKLQVLFDRARQLQNLPPDKYPQSLSGRIVATLFYEPSTRTRLSFEAAVLRLGGKILSTEDAAVASSAFKGESIEDTIKVVSGYADAIVIRNKEKAAADRASKVSPVPIINAGDGSGEHPTQALLDLYTITQEKGQIDGLKIGLAGDVLHSRTIQSLLQALAIYDVEVFLISPPELGLPAAAIEALVKGRPYSVHHKLDDCLSELDVLYMNRIQSERHEVEIKADVPILNTTNIKLMKKDAIITDPLPRVDEIAPEVDADARALYFQQARNGLFIRMALLEDLWAN